MTEAQRNYQIRCNFLFLYQKRTPFERSPQTQFAAPLGPHITFIAMSSRLVDMPSPSCARLPRSAGPSYFPIPLNLPFP